MTGALASRSLQAHPEVPTLMGPRLAEVQVSVARRNCCTDLS